MAGDAVNGDNNTATDNNDGTVSGALWEWSQRPGQRSW